MKKLNLSTKGILWSFVLITILVAQLFLYYINNFALKVALTFILAGLAIFTGYKCIKNVSHSINTEQQIGITKYKNYFSSAIVGMAILIYLYGSLILY